ncbi:retrovirus-related pol polyprotein from transposon TNT 1-94 [Tanacetum coccineum]
MYPWHLVLTDLLKTLLKNVNNNVGEFIGVYSNACIYGSLGQGDIKEGLRDGSMVLGLGLWSKRQGKFDGKSDKGFFVGYLMNSKAFRVYNIRTRKVEENFHIRFLEDNPIIVGNGPKWLFDIDVLTKSMNYVPVVAGTNSNDLVDGLLFDSSLKNASNDEPQPSSDAGKKDDEEPKKVIQALKDPSWIEAIQEELLKFKLQQVWTLVDLPHGKRAISTKWMYMNKKDKRVARIKVNRLFLVYASFKDFVVYQMDVKSAFLYGKIKEEVYVCQPPGFEDPEFPDRVYKVEKALYGLHQALRADSNEKKLIQMIKIHTDQNVADLLIKAFDVANDEIQVSVVGLTYYNPEESDGFEGIIDFLKASSIRYALTIQALVDGKKVIVTKTSVRRALKLKDAEVFLDKQVEGMTKHKEIYVTPSHTKKVFANMKRGGKSFSGRVTPLFQTMIVQAQEEGEGFEMPTVPQHTSPINQPSSSQPLEKQKPRKTKKQNTKVSQPSDLTKPMADETKNMESVPTHSNDLLLSEITKLKERVKKLEKRNKSRTPGLKRLRKGRKITDLDADAEVTLVNEAQERIDDNLMFDTGVF